VDEWQPTEKHLEEANALAIEMLEFFRKRQVEGKSESCISFTLACIQLIHSSLCSSDKKKSEVSDELLNLRAWEAFAVISQWAARNMVPFRNRANN